ncbi:unnamed protein product [Coregonus sp. 'balchen']|nr:unnamed protein product [Coregonus sp. 'balchen']
MSVRCHQFIPENGSHSTFVETCHFLSLVSMSLRQFANQQRIYIVPDAHGCSIETLATDRHPSVRVHLRDSHADIWHEYDLWYIAKGVMKPLNTSSAAF